MTATTSAAIGAGTTSSLDEPLSGNGSAGRAASATVDRIAAGAHQMVDRVAAAADSAAQRLSVKSDDLAVAKERWMQSCGAYVKENPLMALGIAAAVGFLISRWMR